MENLGTSELGSMGTSKLGNLFNGIPSIPAISCRSFHVVR